ncbi:tyrosine kinase receptor Cad96Ca-like [Ixodes scapularis]|uniref:tyrosine kinase receptor Cad96Ca-like n=1 Tax=Ixodes scapularis TaxID=6945 RepID=UPI001C390730|nr:tyrosine kinase receptor Cad96Ca-like [Ixodes scapularis]
MHYIRSRGTIHRDLAARNVLDDEHGCYKVADFGLSRSTMDSETDVYHQYTYHQCGGWLRSASTFIYSFPFKSDAWAFGMLLWDIVTLGSTPYPGPGAQEVTRHVRGGHGMTQPIDCSWELYRW